MSKRASGQSSSKAGEDSPGLPRIATRALLFFLSWILSSTLAPPASASYAIYVGRDASAGGAVLVGGAGEEVSSHWLVAMPRREHPPGATIRVGVQDRANIPGEPIEIPQARTTFRYLSMDYSEFEGFPAPLTNGGLNEHQVAVRDVWSPSRRELVEMTPTPQRGPQYSDLARIVLERARTARQGAALIGELIERHGYSTYGGNTHLIADPDEGWVVMELAGGRGLWVAERLAADEIRVLYPGAIEEIPADYRSHPDYMGSENLVSFAHENGWHEPGTPFNVRRVYAERALREGRWPKLVTPAQLEAELRARTPLTLSDLMGLVRDPRIADEEAGYGQVARLERIEHPELAVLWVAPSSSVTAPFVPFFVAQREVLPELAQHRYLTKDAGRTFLDPQYQAQEATRFAGRIFKRLLYHVCAHPERFLPEVVESFRAFEADSRESVGEARDIASVLLGNDRPDLAARHLTVYSDGRAAEALRLGEALLASIEARTKLLYGIRRPAPGASIHSGGGETPNCLPDADPDRPPDGR